jgi:AraC-like DNA-binding protein
VVLYCRLFSEATIVTLEERGDRCRISMRVLPPTKLAVEEVDALAAVGARLCRLLGDGSHCLRSVELRRPPVADPARFRIQFRAPVSFGCTEDALILDRAKCEERIRGANPELARANDVVAADALARLDSPVCARVRAALVEALPKGNESHGEIARVLGISTRRLDRQLAAESTTYRELVDETRRQLALAYLHDDRFSITEIGFLLGFACSASFTRAFRRWTGQPPVKFRRDTYTLRVQRGA